MARFDLTTGTDTLTGTGGDDRFLGRDEATLQTSDTIDGGAGTDRLVATTDRNGTPAPTIANVERIRLDTGGQPVSLANVSGAERLATLGSSIIVEDIGTDDLGIRFDAKDVQSGTVQLRFQGGVLEADDDVLNLRATGSNVTFTSDSTFDSTADGEQNRTEDALRIEEINILLRGGNPAAEFGNQVDISDFSAIETLRLRGDATDNKIVVDSPELERVDAVGTTGGVTLTSDIAGDQVMLGGSGDDDFKSGSGNDALLGFDGDDVLDAGEGDNEVFGGEGNDTMTSESGADYLFGGAGDDTIDAGSGDDRVRGGEGNDEIEAGDGADRVFAEAGDDTVRGGGGDDVLSGGEGNDALFGGGDDDVLFSEGGDDTLNGGGGQDLFFIADGSSGTDTIEDFSLTSDASTNDTIRFRFDGGVQRLTSQEDFEAFYDANQGSGRVTADANADTVTIRADGGTVTLNVSDADFLLA